MNAEPFNTGGTQITHEYFPNVVLLNSATLLFSTSESARTTLIA